MLPGDDNGIDDQPGLRAVEGRMQEMAHGILVRSGTGREADKKRRGDSCQCGVKRADQVGHDKGCSRR
jgi:hypothetical protein